MQEKYVRAPSKELERAILLPGKKKNTVKVEMLPATAVLKQVDLLIEQKRSWLDELQKKKLCLVDARAKKTEIYVPENVLYFEKLYFNF